MDILNCVSCFLSSSCSIAVFKEVMLGNYSEAINVKFIFFVSVKIADRRGGVFIEFVVSPCAVPAVVVSIVLTQLIFGKYNTSAALFQIFFL